MSDFKVGDLVRPLRNIAFTPVKKNITYRVVKSVPGAIHIELDGKTINHPLSSGWNPDFFELFILKNKPENSFSLEETE